MWRVKGTKRDTLLTEINATPRYSLAVEAGECLSASRAAQLTSSESCEMNVLEQMNRITEPASYRAQRRIILVILKEILKSLSLKIKVGSSV
jgi:carbonic anhydrase